MNLTDLSPMAAKTPSPMVISVSPTFNPNNSATNNLEFQYQNGASLPGPEPSQKGLNVRSKKPPPLHTGADWKVILHLPEIETWLRETSDRVGQLTHSVGEDGENRHVDVHLVQLKDICEDISDHVEQIHALLETEFSLKLLSYSVSVIVDIRTVQLLWHQLRVSVLVLKERLLQTLQDSNGNYTRQTDILQAFRPEQQQTRLDDLTEVDDCGQLTIRCSQDYFSLDCGITAFELSDYSPSDENEAQVVDSIGENPSQQQVPVQPADIILEVKQKESKGSNRDRLPQVISSVDIQRTTHRVSVNHAHSPSMILTMHNDMSKHNESVKRPLQGKSYSSDVSPSQPSLPKRAALFSDCGTRVKDSDGQLGKVSPHCILQGKPELSQSSPSVMEHQNRSRFWLELDSVYPENASQSCGSLQVMNWQNLQTSHKSSKQGGGPEGNVQRSITHQKFPSGARLIADNLEPHQESCQAKKSDYLRGQINGGKDDNFSYSSLSRMQHLSSDSEVSGEESDLQTPHHKMGLRILKCQEQNAKQQAQVSDSSSPLTEQWYGSEDFLALPAQLCQMEILDLNLEAQSLPLRSGHSPHEALQDVDDWDLNELSPDWDIRNGAASVKVVRDETDEDVSPEPLQPPHGQNHFLPGQFSPNCWSDIAPSLDESTETGCLSDVRSEEEEGRRSTDCCLQLPVPPLDQPGVVNVVQQLLEDIQSQDKDPDVWKKIESFVRQLDDFISWLHMALDTTENWTPPRQDVDSLKAYLDTHLSFKMDVDGHSALKEIIMEEGRVLLSIITSNQSGLKDILLIVSSQWEQLQRQIRRQHGWMLHTLHCVKTRLLHSDQSQEPVTFPAEPSSSQRAPCPVGDLKAQLNLDQNHIHRDAIEQMVTRLSSAQYPSSTSRRCCSQQTRSNSVQEVQAEYQELWDWLMDMDAMVTDSHQLMMSEEQKHLLYKSSLSEMMMMDSRRSDLMDQVESLKRSGAKLPSNFQHKLHNLTHKWRQLEKILSVDSGTGPFQWKPSPSAITNCPLVGGHNIATGSAQLAVSPQTSSLLEQLEARIKELKVWLRDTELLIFNSCLSQDKESAEQLLSFKSLCADIRSRRRGVSSVLKLCQKLLQQSLSGPMAKVGPDVEQHQEALQLLSINLERRWEAILMQALQWQNRLKRELQVPGTFLGQSLDLLQSNLVSATPGALPLDESWEWDEMDITTSKAEPDLMQDLPTKPNLSSDGVLSNGNHCIGTRVSTNQCPEIISHTSRKPAPEGQHGVTSQCDSPDYNATYQVYSLHDVKLYRQPLSPCTPSSPYKTKASKRQLLEKSLSKDSSFSSIESLPDLLGGLVPHGGESTMGFMGNERDGGRGSGQSVGSQQSESESGIVSDTGDTETNSEIQGRDKEQENRSDKTESLRKGDFMSDEKCDTQGESREEIGADKRTNRERKAEDKQSRYGREEGEAGEILMNGCGSSNNYGSRSPNTKFKVECCNSLDAPCNLSHCPSTPLLSQSSSLESLLALGAELFPSMKDSAYCSPSLDSILLPCSSSNGDNTGCVSSLGELGLGRHTEIKTTVESVQGERSSGELSRRTLDLLNRLENIQRPVAGNMTRSVSDMTLCSNSPQWCRLSASHNFGRRCCLASGVLGSSCKGSPSLINSSAAASLTELDNHEDSTIGTEDFAVLRNQQHCLLDPATATNVNSHSYRKRCQGSGQGGHGFDDVDVASLSMVVNVSCTSACTDEDDSDLLSSSTLTLTEEELGVREGEDEDDDRLSGFSSGNEDDDDDDNDEVVMERSYVLGLKDAKWELQTWMRPPLRSTSSKAEVGIRDELQCGTRLSLSSSSSMSSSQNTPHGCFLSHAAGQSTKKTKEKSEEMTRSYVSLLVDDLENGNIDQSCLSPKDECDDLLQDESSVFTKKGESLREANTFPQTDESLYDMKTTSVPPSLSCDLLSFTCSRASSLVDQLSGELPCHRSSLPSPPSLSPVEYRSHDALLLGRVAAGGRKAITIQENFKFSSFVKEESRQEVRDNKSPLPPKKRHITHCCSNLPSSTTSSLSLHPHSAEEATDEDQAEAPNQTKNNPVLGSTSLAQIKHKVLERSPRPLQLRKGDFYSYLSLSSHDSDCGEVTQFSEEKMSTPGPLSVIPPPGPSSPKPEPTLKVESKNSLSDFPSADVHGVAPPLSPDIRDEEMLFAACTEEVYLGPPLCYSMVLTTRPRRSTPKLTEEPNLVYLSCSDLNGRLQYLSRPGPKPDDSLS